TVRVQGAGARDTRQILQEIGLTPLPPYILKARKDQGLGDQPDDPFRYQTVFADAADHQNPHAAPDVTPGSVAAPTAGLHFTPELRQALHARGIQRADVTLHVGAGTFRPIETDHVEDHPIHAEWCSMPGETLRQIRETRARGGRIIPVGTTAVR